MFNEQKGWQMSALFIYDNIKPENYFRLILPDNLFPAFADEVYSPADDDESTQQTADRI